MESSARSVFGTLTGTDENTRGGDGGGIVEDVTIFIS